MENSGGGCPVSVPRDRMSVMSVARRRRLSFFRLCPPSGKNK